VIQSLTIALLLSTTPPGEVADAEFVHALSSDFILQEPRWQPGDVELRVEIAIIDARPTVTVCNDAAFFCVGSYREVAVMLEDGRIIFRPGYTPEDAVRILMEASGGTR
jgi:hypothetical protein